MLKCIYCLKEDNKLSAEHVIPKSFGLFSSKTYVLHHVCNGCNSYFDITFERDVYRKSIFSVLKHELISTSKAVIKSKSVYRYIESSDLLKIQENSNDIWKGAHLKINLDNKKIFPMSQIGFKIKDGNNNYKFYIYKFLKKNIHILKKEAERVKLLKDKNTILIYGENTQKEQELYNFLNKHNIPLNKKKKFVTYHDHCLPIKIVSTPNILLSRAIAKIAFNFFAYWSIELKNMPSDHIYKKCYDIIRNYIRYGAHSKIKIISMDEKPIINTIRNINGHFVILESTGKEVYSRLHLFQNAWNLVFTVVLGIPKPGFSLHIGKCFDYKNNNIIDIKSDYNLKTKGIKIINFN